MFSFKTSRCQPASSPPIISQRKSTPSAWLRVLYKAKATPSEWP
jgi:hypothetical protein